MNGKQEKRKGGALGQFLALMLLLVVLTVTTSTASQDYCIRNAVLNSGGGNVSAGSFVFKNSFGQPTPIGTSRSASFGLHAGFQPTTLTEFVVPDLQRGDCTCDGSINILDVLAAINHILDTVPMTPEGLALADCNDDGVVNILDAIGIVNVILGIGQCAPDVCKSEVTTETINVFKSLESYLPAETYARLMILIKEQHLPAEHSLVQNYPNPFNPSTTIYYILPNIEHRAKSGEAGMSSTLHALRTSLKIYNILGQEVKTLVDEVQEPGNYTVMWDGKDNCAVEVSSGVYFYCLTSGNFTATKRMVFMK